MSVLLSDDWTVTLPDDEIVSGVDAPDWDFLLVHSYDGPLGLPGGVDVPSVIEVFPSGGSGFSQYERPLERVRVRLLDLGVPLGFDFDGGDEDASYIRSPTGLVWFPSITAFSVVGCPDCGLRVDCPHLFTKYYGTYGLWEVGQYSEDGVRYERLGGGLWREGS